MIKFKSINLKKMLFNVCDTLAYVQQFICKLCQKKLKIQAKKPKK